MTTEVLGNLSFLEVPTVNGSPLLLNAGGVPSIMSGVTGDRPAAGTAGRLFIDTTLSQLQRDTGSSWITIGSSTVYTGTASQISVSGSVISLASNAEFPGIEGVRLPIGTTAGRSATPSSGVIRFNSSLGHAEEFTGTYWGPLGLVLQQVSGNIPASSGNSLIPYDNTTPLSTEGSQIWTVGFTPISPTSRIMITFTITAASSITTAVITCALFAGTTVIGAVSNRAAASAGQPINLTINKIYSPGSTATITFSARLGSNATSTTYCNQGSAATLGGAYVSSYTITEIE